MKSQNLHIIHRLVFELKVSKRSAARAQALQHEISRLHTEELLPEMEAVLDRLCPPGEVIRVDKLVLDLGKLNRKNLNSELGKRISAMLSEKLELHQVRLLNQAGKLAAAGVNEERIDHISVAESKKQLFLFFLMNGRLPWWAGTTENFDPVLSFQQLLEEAREAVTGCIDRRELFQVLQESRAAIRFIHQITPELIIKAVEFLFPASAGEIFALEEIIKEIIPGAYPGKQSFLTRLIGLFPFLDQVRQTEASDPAVPAVFFRELLKRDISLQDPEVIKKVIVRKVRNKDVQNALISEIRKWEGTKPERYDHSAVGNGETKELKKQNDPGLSKNVKGEKAVRKEQEPEGWLVPNAGLVLLWPFLGAFFKNLNLTEARSFSSEEARLKAVFMLNFLATGNQEAFDHELVFAKVVCGVDPETPFPRSIPVSRYEAEEGEDLLKSLIRHWAVLKNTSPDGLRNSFLKREGLLYSGEDKILVRIERTGIDVLLDKLPFGLTVIKLPWLKQILQADW